MLLSVVDFVGRFHPVVVHLPIGILLLGGFFQLFSRKYTALQPALPYVLLWGGLGAVVSCITGYLLSTGGGYDPDLTSQHQWLGIATAFLSFVFYFVVKGNTTATIRNGFAFSIIGLITITGHLGGSLTHGSGYLTEGFSGGEASGLKPIPNVQEAVLYTDIVQPILKSRCYSCHGSEKQRGKLRLDDEAQILAGGESGAAVVPGNVDDSELIKRLLLPISNDEHMPPKEKPQLSKEEIALLSWWVNSGADFGKKVKDLEQPEAVKPVLAALQSGSTSLESDVKSAIPDESVNPADEKALSALREAGAVVLPTARDNNYLTVSFITAGKGVDSLIELLDPIRKQLVWLRLDDSDVSDAAMARISKLSNLTRLYLTNTKVTDDGIAQLRNLKQLQVLNLVNTAVTDKGLLSLKDLEALRAIYLYKSRVDKARWSDLKTAFPAAVLDSGGYQVPILPSDTTLVTP